MLRIKDKSIFCPPPFFTKAQLHSFILNSSTPSSPFQAAWGRRAGLCCSQSTTVSSSLLLLPLHAFPLLQSGVLPIRCRHWKICSSMGPFYGLQFLPGEPAPVQVGHGLQIIQGISMCSSMISSTGCRGISAPAHGADTFSPSESGVCRTVSDTSSQLGSFLPFLNHIFPEAPLAFPIGTAVSCGGSPLQPVTFSHRGHSCRHLTTVLYHLQLIQYSKKTTWKKKRNKTQTKSPGYAHYIKAHTEQTEVYKGKKFH